MNQISLLFAKLAGLHKAGTTRLKNAEFKHRDHFGKYDGPDDDFMADFHKQLKSVQSDLKQQLPELYADVTDLKKPELGRDDENGHQLADWISKIEYLLEVRTHSRLGEDLKLVSTPSEAIFIGYDDASIWKEISAALKKDLQVEIKSQPLPEKWSRKTLQKLSDLSAQCAFAILIVSQGQDAKMRLERAEDWLIYEIAFLQGRCGLSNVCVLHEEGIEIPSNLPGIQYVSFPHGSAASALGALMRAYKSETSQD